MKKTKITETEFGKVVEEIPAGNFDCRITHIYISNLGDDTLSYLKEYANKLSYEKLLNSIIHWGDEVETFYYFCKEYLVY